MADNTCQGFQAVLDGVPSRVAVHKKWSNVADLLGTSPLRLKNSA